MRDFGEITTRRPGPRRRLWAWPLLAVLVMVAGVGVLADGLAPAEGGPDLRPLASFSREPMNVLVLGVDRQKGVEGVRADVVMLARVEPATGEVRLLSIPRDMLVETEPGTQDRINAAYARRGVVGEVRAVERFTGIEVDHHAVVSFTGFRRLVDAVGGVEVNVREGDYPPGWKLEEGTQTLDGRRALLYVRYRGGPGGDLARIERQQQVVAALRSGLLRPRTADDLPEIARAVDENVRTDLGVGEMLGLGRVLLDRGEDAGMTHARLRGEPRTLPDGRQVLVPDREANEAIVADFLR